MMKNSKRPIEIARSVLLSIASYS